MGRPADADQYVRVLRLLVNTLKDDVRVSLLVELATQGPCSLHSLSRRLGVGHRKVGRALKQLESLGVIRVHSITAGGGRKYKFYSVDEAVGSVLREALKSSHTPT